MIPQQSSTELEVVALVAGDERTVRPAAPTLIIGIEAATARVRVRGGTLVVDRATCVVVPAGEPIRLAPTTAASRVALVGFGAAVIATTAREYAALGFAATRLAHWLRRPIALPRTVWIHELAHRYVFERHALAQHDNLTTRFVEIELVKELYFACRDRDAGAERANIVRGYGAVIERAVAHIEAHLFDPPNISALARIAGASASTLLRLFRREVGGSPGAYWRHRKLDEALVALRGGLSVGEAASRIGYDNPTAFGFAFRRRFGRPPSAFRPRRALRPAP